MPRYLEPAVRFVFERNRLMLEVAERIAQLSFFLLRRSFSARLQPRRYVAMSGLHLDIARRLQPTNEMDRANILAPGIRRTLRVFS
jgi:hypothetical protein